MTGPVDDTNDEIRRLKKRLTEMGRRKANLQMAVDLINQVTRAAGVVDIVDHILQILVEAIGGSSISIYYRTAGKWQYTDILGNKVKLDEIDDQRVKKAVEQNRFLKFKDPEAPKLTIPGFPKTRETWIYPLYVHHTCFGAVRLQGMAIEHAHYRDNIDPFIKYSSLVLYHEVSNLRKLESAYRKVSRSKDELEQANRLLTSVIENSPQAIVAFDSGKKITIWSTSAEKMFGWTRREIDDDVSYMLSISDKFEALFNDVLSGEYITDLAIACQRKEGSIFDGSLSASPIVDSKGTIRGGMFVIADVTWRKKVEERFNHIQKMESIGNLAAGIAHDFNNILFPIVGLSEILLEDLPAGGQEHRNVNEIYTAGLRGSDLVKQILAFSRQSDHKQIPVRIQRVLKEVLGLCRSTIPSDIEIVQDIQNDCAMVLADPTQLHQTAMNLITNAYHAVEESGGKISVSLSEKELEPGEREVTSLPLGRYAELTISDTGHGIDPAILDKVFDPYFTTKNQGKGTGLGLAVAYGIVKKHGGEIKIRSRVGKGTACTVYLPLLEASPKSAQTAVPERDYSGNERIMLVDDELSIVKLEKQLLERLGYRVTTCVSSLEAFKTFMAAPKKFDLIITDMSMPQMTGLQLATKLLSARPDLPVIMCTGFSERIDQKKAYDSGIKGFLMKPIVRTQLAKMVRGVLDRAAESL